MEGRHATLTRVRAAVPAPLADRPALTSAIVVFAAALAIALLQGSKPFVYDARGYWLLSETFVRDGHFSLLNFDSPLRGYLLPLTFHGITGIADLVDLKHSTMPKLFNSLVLSLLAAVLLPALAQLAWPERRWGFWRRLGLAAVLLVFWHGYLAYPLSDFPALAAVVLALIAVARVDAPGWMLLAGVAAAAAVNMRPAYLLTAPVLALLVAFAWWQQRGRPHASWPRRALCAGLALVGFAVVALPQSLSAHRHHETWSFVPGAAAGLSTLQFTEGMRMQRYDTYVGTQEPSPRMVYVDPTGERVLMQQEGGQVNNTRQYLRMIAERPALMSGVFFRHVVNGLDQRYPTPYVERIDTGGSRWLRIAGFLLVFLALLRVAWPTARRSLGPARWQFPAALLLCGATALASAVETRFLLPVVAVVYVIVLTPGWPNPLALARAQSGGRRLVLPLLLAGSLALFLAVVLGVAAGASDNLRFT